MKISYPVVVFSQDDSVTEGLHHSFSSSRNLSVISDLTDTKPRTMKKLRFIYPSIVLVHFGEVQAFDAQVVSELKSVWPEAGLIMYTPVLDDDMIRQSFHAGADGYVVQERSTSQLEAILTDFLDKGTTPVSAKVVSRVIGMMKRQGPIVAGKQRLTLKQKNIAGLLVNGHSYEEIAEQMGMRLDAVRYHIKQIYKKYDINKSTQLSRMMLG